MKPWELKTQIIVDVDFPQKHCFLIIFMNSFNTQKRGLFLCFEKTSFTSEMDMQPLFFQKPSYLLMTKLKIKFKMVQFKLPSWCKKF